jgi:hypothetical protein
VDFEGGNQDLQTDARRVFDRAPIELLVLLPDGRLVVRNSLSDTEDRERKERLEDWRNWLEKVGASGDKPSKGVFD